MIKYFGAIFFIYLNFDSERRKNNMLNFSDKLASLKGNGKLRRTRDICALVLSVLLMLLGIAFAFSCIHIYLTNPAPAFSREVVGGYLIYLAAPSAIVILLIIAVGIMSCLLAEAKERVKAEKDSARDLRRILQKHAFTYDGKTAFGLADTALSLGNSSEAVKKSIFKRLIIFLITLTETSVLFIVALFTALNFERFDTVDITGDVLFSSLILFPLAFIALALIYIAVIYTHKLKANEVVLLKAAIKENNASEGEQIKNVYKQIGDFKSRYLSKVQNVITIVIVLIGVVFVILGSQNGGMAAVLEKAVRICTECIGLS